MRSFLKTLFTQMLYRFAVAKIRQRVQIVYLKALQALRKSLLLCLFAFICVQMMVLGFVGAVITGIWLAPLEPETKWVALFSVFSVLFLVPTFGLMFLFSQKTWLKVGQLGPDFSSQTKN